MDTTKTKSIMVEEGLIKKPEIVPEITLLTKHPDSGRPFDWVGFTGQFFLGTGYQANLIQPIFSPVAINLGMWYERAGLWNKPTFLPEFSLQLSDFEMKEKNSLDRLAQVLNWLAELSGLYTRMILPQNLPQNGEKGYKHEIFLEFRQCKEVPPTLQNYQERGVKGQHFGIPALIPGSVAVVQPHWENTELSKVLIGTMIEGKGLRAQYGYLIPAITDFFKIQADLESIAKSNGLIAKFDVDYIGATFLRA